MPTVGTVGMKNGRMPFRRYRRAQPDKLASNSPRQEADR